MLFYYFDWDLTYLYFFFIFILPSHHRYKPERPALENAYTLVQRTDIFSWKFSVKVSLMLENRFIVPSLCKLNHISPRFIQIRAKSPAKLLILWLATRKALFFETILGVLGRSVNFNIT